MNGWHRDKSILFPVPADTARLPFLPWTDLFSLPLPGRQRTPMSTANPGRGAVS